MRVPALIIGAGPAGSAAAITLSRAGMAVQMMERQSGLPHGVCGAFLGWDAIRALEDLGIDPWRLGARPIARVRLISGRRRIEADLPGLAAGLSRRLLDSALVEAARRSGAAITHGRTARVIAPLTRTVRFDDGETVTADALFLATGKHELRGMARQFTASSIGLRAALPPDPALAGVVELHLFDQGYAGLLSQEDGATNFCLSITRDRLNRAGNIARLLSELKVEAPALAERLDRQEPHFEAIAGVPYGWHAQDSHDGIFRIGDQAAVIASLAGDGIAIALTSGAGAARALLADGPAGAARWQRRFARQSRRPIRIAETLRHGAASPLARSALMGLLHHMPGLAGQAAALTRISRA